MNLKLNCCILYWDMASNLLDKIGIEHGIGIMLGLIVFVINMFFFWIFFDLGLVLFGNNIYFLIVGRIRIRIVIRIMIEPKIGHYYWIEVGNMIRFKFGTL